MSLMELKMIENFSWDVTEKQSREGEPITKHYKIRATFGHHSSHSRDRKTPHAITD